MLQRCPSLGNLQNTIFVLKKKVHFVGVHSRSKRIFKRSPSQCWSWSAMQRAAIILSQSFGLPQAAAGKDSPRGPWALLSPAPFGTHEDSRTDLSYSKPLPLGAMPSHGLSAEVAAHKFTPKSNNFCSIHSTQRLF